MRLKFIAVLLGFLFAGPLHAADPVLKMYGGVNGIWFNGAEKPADFEAGATARASFSPHISGVGGVFYGFDNSYVRGNLGARITTTDVANPNFDIAVGAEYSFCTEPAIRPQEWVGTVTLGWKPYPETMPRVVVGGQGGYGFSSETAYGLLAVRYELGGR